MECNRSKTYTVETIIKVKRGVEEFRLGAGGGLGEEVFVARN